MSYTHDLRRPTSDTITIPCLVLCLLVLLIERVFPMVPDRVTPLYRPIFMAICLLAPATRFYRIREMKYYFAILAYFTVVYLTHAATPENLNAFLSVFTFGLFRTESVERTRDQMDCQRNYYWKYNPVFSVDCFK